jgi:glutathione peroxidase-family protein
VRGGAPTTTSALLCEVPPAPDLDSHQFDFATLRGKVVLVVNTASK